MTPPRTARLSDSGGRVLPHPPVDGSGATSEKRVASRAVSRSSASPSRGQYSTDTMTGPPGVWSAASNGWGQSPAGTSSSVGNDWNR